MHFLLVSRNLLLLHLLRPKALLLLPFSVSFVLEVAVLADGAGQGQLAAEDLLEVAVLAAGAGQGQLAAEDPLEVAVLAIGGFKGGVAVHYLYEPSSIMRS